MIKEIRTICDHYTADGLAVFPTGIAFTFWEQYLHLTWYLFLAIVIIGTAVLCVISVMVFNPWAAAMVSGGGCLCCRRRIALRIFRSQLLSYR